MNHFYEFGSLRLDATGRVVYRDGVELQLTPKLIETLLVLVENAGMVVDKDALIRTVWGDTIVEEGGLKRNISMLRKALGEEGRLIETLPKRGYRFAAEVRERWEETPALAGEPVATELVLRRRANLRVTHQEEITDVDNPGVSFADEPAHMAASRPLFAARLRQNALPLSIATILLLLSGLLIWTISKLNRTSSSTPVKSIAVLPFKNLNATDDDEYLGIGMADVLITRLGNIKDLEVRPTSAILQINQHDQDSIAAGSRLGVDAVLESSMHVVNGRIRVTARLLRVSDRATIWAGQFDETESDIFKLQDALSARLAQSLQVKLNRNEQERFAKRYTDNIEAYRTHLRGRFYLDARSAEGYSQAINHFRQAIEIDSNYALAYAGLADAYALKAQVLFGGKTQAPLFEQAKETAQKALELDDELADAHTVLGWIKRMHEWDWAASEREFKRAIELDPNSAYAHQRYALLLAGLARAREAVNEIEKARTLDPLSPIIQQSASLVYYYLRDFEKSLAIAQQVVKLDPDYERMYVMLPEIYIQMQNYDAALSVLEERFSRGEEKGWVVALRARIYSRRGDKKKTQEEIQKLEAMSKKSDYLAHHLAIVYVEIGDTEKAIDWLQKDYLLRDDRMVWAKVFPVFDTLRAEPQFQAILRKMNLTED